MVESEAEKWYERAQLALAKEEEDLAREALERRQQQMDTAATLKTQLEPQEASLQSLFESMKELESKMSEAKAKKDQIIARARTAKAATKVNDMLAGVGTNSVAAFDRMKDKVEQLEAEAEVSKSMASSALPGGIAGQSTLPGAKSLESKFEALEGSSSVDDELKKMKMGLLPSAVDDELEAMKKDLKKKD